MKRRRWSKSSHQINMRNQINAPNILDICRYGYRRMNFKKWSQPLTIGNYEAQKWAGTLLAIAMRGQQAPPPYLFNYNKK